MRILSGTVKGGAIRMEELGALPEGARVTVIVDDEEDDDPGANRTFEEIPVIDVGFREIAVPVDEIVLQEEP